ncbi:hypothetical protein F2Q70_00036819 [Brassica cretica]|uniref:Uncharacterized protein n=1 Tax=Brassica cretica TaxID=69181 RepID=A0A8S9SNE1_BRACR|nr:hypothetical protein F2Q70_00036819 [Brassica cretica]KAF3601874.1 hypothetical protein F2Q69_00037615 [Brassica cretica]
MRSSLNLSSSSELTGSLKPKTRLKVKEHLIPNHALAMGLHKLYAATASLPSEETQTLSDLFTETNRNFEVQRRRGG